MRPLLFFWLFTFCALSFASIPEWKNILMPGDSCKYFIPNHNLGYTWITTDFNISSWKCAKSGVGFGDNDDLTLIDSSGIYSVYIRYEFNIFDKDDFLALTLDADFDDGFVAYINGNEVARSNINGNVQWNMELAKERKVNVPYGGKPEQFIIKNNLKTLLKTGKNILAIEVHNANPNSKGLSSNFYLNTLLNSDHEQYRDIPNWYTEPLIYSKFNLPLMIINTDGLSIAKEVKIQAKMSLIDNDGANYIFGEPLAYSGLAGFKLHGESTLEFAKKSLNMELQNQDGTSNNVSLLGLPQENDFVLYAPFNDKTMLRNVLTYSLFYKMGQWAPRTRFIELILNGDYQGVYILTEKIKRDKTRVSISKLTPKDTVLPDITGGYILRSDKISGLASSEYWSSPVQQPFHDQHIYQFHDPSYENLTVAQQQYIKDWMQNFDEVLSSNNFQDSLNGYHAILDKNSFVYTLLINELSKNIDGYRYSHYFYKNKDSQSKKLFSGPPWDYDCTYGNLNYRYDDNFPYTYDWVYNKTDRLFWWERLMEDTIFENKVFCTYEKFRNNIFSDHQIFKLIDSCVNYMGPAVDRNFKRHPILGKYVWPNPKYPQTYAEEISNIKSWISDRTKWLDDHWLGKCKYTTSVGKLLSDKELSVFPNPSNFKNIQVVLPTHEDGSILKILDLQGREIYIQTITANENAILLPDFSNLSQGLYLLNFTNKNGKEFRKKLVKN